MQRIPVASYCFLATVFFSMKILFKTVNYEKSYITANKGGAVAVDLVSIASFGSLTVF